MAKLDRGNAMNRPKETKRTSDEVLVAKTGAPWAEWFQILDKAGATIGNAQFRQILNQ
jgi:hypothetical protein